MQIPAVGDRREPRLTLASAASGDQAAFNSRSCFHWPSEARPFMWARCAKARWPAAIVLGLARPRLLRRCLQRAAVGEGEVPRQVADLVHRVEMRGRLLVGLAAGEERDARHRARHAVLQHPDGLLGDLFDAGALGALLAGDRHVRLEHDAFQRDALAIELLELRLEHRLGDLEAAVDVVIAVHQHLGLDDRHDLRRLAERGVARQRMGVGVDRGVARDARADVDHRAPFRERARPARNISAAGRRACRGRR